MKSPTPQPHQPTPELDALLRRMRQKLPSQPDRAREALEATLVPMVSVALRGLGHPTLVRWAREQSSRHSATVLASRLCERLLDRIDPLPGRETVVGV